MSSLTSKAKDGWARWKLGHFYMRDLQDVDVSSTLPADGDVLVWVDADKKWEPGGSGGGGSASWEYDVFDITGSGDVDHSLTHIPVVSLSLFLALNGLLLREGGDYSVNYTTGAVTVSATVTSGDVLTARYMARRGARSPALVQEGSGTGTVTFPAAVTAGNVIVLALMGVNAPTATVSGLSGTWVQLETQSWSGGTNGGALWVGYGLSAGTTISVTGGAGGFALELAHLTDSASVIQSHSSSQATGTVETETVTPSIDNSLVVGFYVIGNGDTADPTPWTDTPTGWTSFTPFIGGSSRVDGGLLTGAAAGAAAQRVGSVSFADTHGRFGVVLR